MPLFEYRCGSCGAQREVLARSAGAVETPLCPECCRTMERQLARVAVPSKGTAAACASPPGGFS